MHVCVYVCVWCMCLRVCVERGKDSESLLDVYSSTAQTIIMANHHSLTVIIIWQIYIQVQTLYDSTAHSVHWIKAQAK